MAGGDDSRHVADIADIDFAGEHAIHNDRALQADLEVTFDPFGRYFS